MSRRSLTAVFAFLVFVSVLSFRPLRAANTTRATTYGFLGGMGPFSLNYVLTVPNLRTTVENSGMAGLYANASMLASAVGTFGRELDTHMGRAVASGVRWVRCVPGIFVWEVVEPTKGGGYRYDFADVAVTKAQTNGLTLVGTIGPHARWDATTGVNPQAPLDFVWWGYRTEFPNDLTAMKAFVTAIVERYDGDGIQDMPGLTAPILYYEVDNEPEAQTGFYSQSGTRYLQALKPIYDAIKAACPTCRIVNGGALETTKAGIEQFWNDFAAGGGFSYLDVFNWHYNDERLGAAADTSAFTQQLTVWKNLMTRIGVNLPMWITEVGTYAGTPQNMMGAQLPEQTEAFQAAWYVERYTLGLAGGVTVFFPDVTDRWDNAIGAASMYDYQTGRKHLFADTLSFMGSLVDGFSAVQTLTTGQHRFTVGARRPLVAWGSGSIGGLSGRVRVTDLYSTSRSIDGSAVTLSSSPVFVESLATLTTNASGSGIVASSPSGSTCGSGRSDCSEHATGTSVTLEATASTGSVFAGWTGDADCLDGVVSLTSAASCTANFVTRLGTSITSGSLDLNGDGGADVLTYDPTAGTWSMELGNRSGSFGAKRGTWVAGWTILAADFNGDGLADFFLYHPTTGAWAKAINTGAFDFTYFTGTWSPGWTPFVVDFDGNGKSDVFIYSVSTGAWFKCVSTGTGTGDFTYSSGQWDAGWEIQPADWNGDRKTDLFLFRRTDGLWIRATNDGSAGFTYYAETWSPIWSFYVGDFSGDGKSDVFLYAATGLWFLCTNTGTSFSYTSNTWSPGWSMFVGDLDANGRADLLLYDAATGVWVEALTDGSGGFTYASGTIAAGWQVALADLTGDRRADLVLYNPTTGSWVQGLNTAAGAFTYSSGTWSAGLTIAAQW